MQFSNINCKQINLNSFSSSFFQKNKIKFRFATGGAGFCLSRPLVERMTSLVGNGELVSTCENIRLPDDVTIGYLVEHVLGTPLTVVPEFHSHLEPLRLISRDVLRDQISFSYGKFDNVDHLPDQNLVEIAGVFPESEDPTRFFSLHCHLFPNLCSEQSSLPWSWQRQWLSNFLNWKNSFWNDFFILCILRRNRLENFDFLPFGFYCDFMFHIKVSWIKVNIFLKDLELPF